MPPRTLRGVTKKAAAELPQHARFSFLVDASKLLAPIAPQLAAHLGVTALQVACNPTAAISKRSILQLCEGCGVHLGPVTCSRVQVVPLSRRSQERGYRAAVAAATSVGQSPNSINRNVVTVLRTCKVCGHISSQPFVSVPAAQQAAQRDMPPAPTPTPGHATSADQISQQQAGHSTGSQATAQGPAAAEGGLVLEVPVLQQQVQLSLLQHEQQPATADSLGHHQALQDQPSSQQGTPPVTAQSAEQLQSQDRQPAAMQGLEEDHSSRPAAPRAPMPPEDQALQLQQAEVSGLGGHQAHTDAVAAAQDQVHPQDGETQEAVPPAQAAADGQVEQQTQATNTPAPQEAVDPAVAEAGAEAGATEQPQLPGPSAQSDSAAHTHAVASHPAEGPAPSAAAEPETGPAPGGATEAGADLLVVVDTPQQQQQEQVVPMEVDAVGVTDNSTQHTREAANGVWHAPGFAPVPAATSVAGVRPLPEQLQIPQAEEMHVAAGAATSVLTTTTAVADGVATCTAVTTTTTEVVTGGQEGGAEVVTARQAVVTTLQAPVVTPAAMDLAAVAASQPRPLPGEAGVQPAAAPDAAMAGEAAGTGEVSQGQEGATEADAGATSTHLSTEEPDSAEVTGMEVEEQEAGLAGQLSFLQQQGGQATSEEREEEEGEEGRASRFGVLAPGRLPPTSDTEEQEGASSEEEEEEEEAAPEQQVSGVTTDDTGGGAQHLLQQQQQQQQQGARVSVEQVDYTSDKGMEGAGIEEETGEQETSDSQEDESEEEEEGGEPGGWRPLVLLRNVQHLRHSPQRQGPQPQPAQPQHTQGRQQPAAGQPSASWGVNTTSRPAGTKAAATIKPLHQQQQEQQQPRHQHLQRSRGARLPKGLGIHRPWGRRAALKRGALAAAMLHRMAQEYVAGQAGRRGLPSL